MEDLLSLAIVLGFAAVALPLVSRQMFYSGVEAERRRNGTPAERRVQVLREARWLREKSRFLTYEAYQPQITVLHQRYYEARPRHIRSGQ